MTILGILGGIGGFILLAVAIGLIIWAAIPR